MTASLHVAAGPGTLARFGDLVVWVGPGASAALMRFLVESARNLGPSTRGGRLIAEHAIGVLNSRDPEPAVPFLTIGPAEQAFAVLLHGPVQAWDGRQWVSPSRDPGWLRMMLAPGTPVVAGPMGVTIPTPAPDGVFDLERGVVPAGGLSIRLPSAATAASPDNGDLPGAPPESPGASAPTAVFAHPSYEATVALPQVAGDPAATLPAGAPPSDAPTRALPEHPQPPTAIRDLHGERGDTAGSPLPLGGAPPSTATGTVVRGVRCPNGHFNHPDSPTCVRCGVTIGPADRAPISGARPSLGALVLEDGSVFGLDRGYLVGHDPERDPTVSGGLARPLRLDDDAIADSHVEVRLSDWAIALIDRGSEQGTFALPPGGQTWERLTPYQPFGVPAGTHVAAGHRVFTITSPWPGPPAPDEGAPT